AAAAVEHLGVRRQRRVERREEGRAARALDEARPVVVGRVAREGAAAVEALDLGRARLARRVAERVEQRAGAREGERAARAAVHADERRGATRAEIELEGHRVRRRARCPARLRAYTRQAFSRGYG